MDLSSAKKILDSAQIKRAVTRMAHEICERNADAKTLAVVGVRTRGEHLASRLAEKIKEIEGREVNLGVIDITLYRDDLTNSTEQPLVRGTDLPFNVDKSTIILVDDVLFTGRTIRSALDAIIDFGRPRSVQLAVLCDRGHRELPIRPDFVGKSIPTEKHEMVLLRLSEVDAEEALYVKSRSSAK